MGFSKMLSGAEPNRLGHHVDAVVQSAVRDETIVGSAGVVLLDGRLVHRFAAGFADRDAGRRVRDGTVFRLASLSKLFVAAAAMTLVDRRQLDLDLPVSTWLPTFKPHSPDGSVPVITVRQLLTHTAGMAYPFGGAEAETYRKALVSSGLDQPGLGMTEQLSRIAAAGLLAPPGSRWVYSVAIDVVGAVIEAIMRAPLPDAIDRLIASPLGLNSVGFHVRKRDRLAAPYYSTGADRPRRMAPLQDVQFPDGSVIRFAPDRMFNADSFPSGGAGMVADAADVAALLETVRLGGGRLMSPSSASLMATSQTGSLPIALGPGWGFGFGGAVLTDAGKTDTPQSNGTWMWGGVYGNTWFVDPVRRLTVVALTNTAPQGESGLFPVQLRDAIYEALN
jgi:CubicO group peptidase (beta-lactamase class C family)